MMARRDDITNAQQGLALFSIRRVYLVSDMRSIVDDAVQWDRQLPRHRARTVFRNSAAFHR